MCKSYRLFSSQSILYMEEKFVLLHTLKQNILCIFRLRLRLPNNLYGMHDYHAHWKPYTSLINHVFLTNRLKRLPEKGKVSCIGLTCAKTTDEVCTSHAFLILSPVAFMEFSFSQELKPVYMYTMKQQLLKFESHKLTMLIYS